MKQKTKQFITSLAEKMEDILCILNGIIGDTLEEKEIDLAVKMTLYTSGRPLPLTKRPLSKIKLPSMHKVCILVHGNCSSENGWGFQKNNAINYGSLLKRDFGFTPFYLRYNSGLHISTNGRRLSELLEHFVLNSPKKIHEMALIGHSMGGLLIRSACHYGTKEKRKWVRHVSRIFYLGTPHMGSYLEKLGKQTTTFVSKVPNPLSRLFVTLGDLRSVGIKDMLHGYLIDEDWNRKNAYQLNNWYQKNIPLLKTADHFFICSSLTQAANSKLDLWFGDGVVHAASCMGHGLFSCSTLPFSPDHCKIIPAISHINLQRNQKVYRQMKEWFKQKTNCSGGDS